MKYLFISVILIRCSHLTIDPTPSSPVFPKRMPETDSYGGSYQREVSELQLI